MAVQSDSDDNEDFTGSEGRATPGATESRQKKQKVGARREVDTTRKLKSKKAFAGKDAGGAFIHAADILSSARVSKRAGGVIRDDTIVTLQYPSDSARERYASDHVLICCRPANAIADMFCALSKTRSIPLKRSSKLHNWSHKSI
jgi:hypothetical protein